MTIYYSKSQNAFYDSGIHGERTKLVPDPKWRRPTKKVPDPNWKGGSEKHQTIEVLDEDADHPQIEVANEACKLPDDAVEISGDLHTSLLNAQSDGRVITSDKDGFPVAVEAAPLSDEELARDIRAQRNAALLASDWTQLADIPEETRKKWAAYRQELRDVSKQTGWPRNFKLPEAPK